MEKNKNEIEDLMKNSFDDFEPEVEPTVWKNVKTAIKWGGAGLLIKFIINKIGTNTLVAFLSSAITIVSTVWVMDWKKASDKTQSENTKTEITPSAINEKPIVIVEENNKKTEPIIIKETTKQNNDERGIPEQRTREKSFKNTSLVEVGVSKDDVKKVINELSGKSISVISASPVSGAAPLIVNLLNIGTGVENKWIFSDGQKTSTEINPARAFLQGVHTVILQSKSADGTIATDSIKITVTGNSSIASPPNVFSPNDDGVADVFTFQSKNMTSMEAEIYDKKSNLIYKWVGIDGKWDGRTVKGERAPEGNYYYIVNSEGIDGKKYEQKGIIKLTR